MRLIDADALTMVTEFIDGEKHEYFEKFEIDDAPTIEAEPIRHGHWIYTERGFPLAYGYNRCSVCGRSIGLDSTDYCPHCGAKMDEEETEDEGI